MYHFIYCTYLLHTIDRSESASIITSKANGTLPILPFPKVVDYKPIAVASLSTKQFLLSINRNIITNIHTNSDESSSSSSLLLRSSSIVNRFTSRMKSYTFANNLSGSILSLDINKINVYIVNNTNSTGSSIFYHQLGDNIDEYIIQIEQSRLVSIISSSAYGISAAFATLSQLLNVLLVVPSIPMVIHDWSDYKWRGMLIDVARHYIPIRVLERTINAMEISKMNVLHLHLTDSQSFPILLHDTKEYNLSQLAVSGSFSYPSQTYTIQSLKSLVQYALDRGIEIIPEIDIPAHALSWGKADGFHDIIINCTVASSHAQSPSDIYLLNPTNTKSLEVISGILTQIADIFPSKYLHVGGDEVNFNCLKEDIHVQSLIDSGTVTVYEIMKQFEEKVFMYVRKLNKVPIVWQGLLDSSTLPDEPVYTNTTQTSIVQPWKCWSGLAVRAAKQAYKDGHHVVMSACWYLDYDEDWSTYLSSNLIATASTEIIIEALRYNYSDSGTYNRYNQDIKGKFYGGEASLWSEHVDASNFECRVWPRAAFVASQLWGMPSFMRIGGGGSSSSVGSRLDVDVYKLTLVALVYYRTYLYDQDIVSAADLKFHQSITVDTPTVATSYTIAPTKKTTNEYKLYTRTINNVTEAIDAIYTINNSIIFPLKNGRIMDSIAITSSCMGLPQDVMRPVSSPYINIAQLNINDGAKGQQKLLNVTNWIKGQVNRGLLAIGLCELNNWNDFKSNSVSDTMNNYQLIVNNSAAAGLVHSHILVSRDHPYNIGFLAAMPFDVIAEYGPPRFQRGVLHVYFASIHLNVIVAHLHSGSSIAREAEAHAIAEIIRPILQDKSKQLIVMGDLNTLSRYDSVVHAESRLADVVNRRDHWYLKHLKEKYLDTLTNTVNYKPMDILLNAGLFDSCIVGCQTMTSSASVQWSISSNTSFSVCMKTLCLKSEPTKYTPEWPTLQDRLKHPDIRLDYVLVSKSIVELGDVSSRIDMSPATDYLSDHYPITARWPSGHYTDNDTWYKEPIAFY